MKKTRKRSNSKIKKPIVIQSPLDPKLQIAVASEMADDEMIEKEMLGEVLPYYVYKFTQEGKDVVGLTVKGVNEVIRRLNKDNKSGSKIRLNPNYLLKEEKEYDGEKGIEVSVYAEDLVTGNTAWGIKFEPYRKTGRKGSYKNTFAVEKALSKAERNAKKKLINETMASKIIQKIIQSNPESVKTLAPATEHDVTVHPKIPQATTGDELSSIIITAIKKSKDIDKIMEMDEKAQKSDKLSKEAKSLIHSEANYRVEQLQIIN